MQYGSGSITGFLYVVKKLVDELALIDRDDITFYVLRIGFRIQVNCSSNSS